MNETHEIELRKLLKKGLGPPDQELRRDLWPEMVRRMEKGERRVPWFDWALLAGLVGVAALFPTAIPVLLYYL